MSNYYEFENSNNGVTEENNKQKKEDDSMIANTAVKVDNNIFNDFLKLNKAKIKAVTPKNPTISQKDEWVKETCWDNDYKEQNDK